MPRSSRESQARAFLHKAKQSPSQESSQRLLAYIDWADASLGLLTDDGMTVARARTAVERLERAGSESSAVEWRDVIAAIKKIQEEKKRK